VLVGMIGDDDDGRVIREYLDGWGVPFIATPGPHGTGRAISDRRGGEPSYRFNRASIERGIRVDDALRELVSNAALIAISGFPFDNTSQVGQLLGLLGGSPASVAIDPNPRAGLLIDAEAFRGGLERTAASAALVKLSEEDAELLYREPLDTVVDRYLPLVSMAVLATRGEHGASLHTHESATSRPIVSDPRPIVDTMGAGDAAFAVTLQALSIAGPSGAVDWPTVLDAAMLTAAETIRHAGALLRRNLDGR
jgi:fructokinase